MRYIINTVLMPQFDYLITDWISVATFIDKIDQKIKSGFRNKCTLLKVFSTSAV